MQNETSTQFLEKLESVAAADVASLKKAQKSYGTSWKLRGGVGAFMMLARKWDRLENFLKKLSEKYVGVTLKDKGISDYDIFAAIELDTRPEGIIDDIRDLRRYLMLVEAEMVSRGIVAGEVKKDLSDLAIGREVPGTKKKHCDEPNCPLTFEHQHPKSTGMENPRGFDAAEEVK